jgi:hypothetical protein
MLASPRLLIDLHRVAIAATVEGDRLNASDLRPGVGFEDR